MRREKPEKKKRKRSVWTGSRSKNNTAMVNHGCIISSISMVHNSTGILVQFSLDKNKRILDKHSTMFELLKRQVLALLDAGIIYKLDIYTKRIKSISEISEIIAELLYFNLDDSRLLAVYFYRISGYIIGNSARS